MRQLCSCSATEAGPHYVLKRGVCDQMRQLCSCSATEAGPHYYNLRRELCDQMRQPCSCSATEAGPNYYNLPGELCDQMRQPCSCSATEAGPHYYNLPWELCDQMRQPCSSATLGNSEIAIICIILLRQRTTKALIRLRRFVLRIGHKTVFSWRCSVIIKFSNFWASFEIYWIPFKPCVGKS